MQFLERCAQVLKVFCLNRIDAGKDHRLGFLEAGNSIVARLRDVGDGVTDLDLGRGLNAGNDVTDVTGRDGLSRLHVELEHTYLVGIVLLASVEEPHTIAGVHSAVYYFVVSNDAAERIEDRVKDKALQWCFRVTLRRRDTVDDGIEYLRHAVTRLGGTTQYLFALATQQVDDFILHEVRHGRFHVALVHDRDNLQVMVQRHVEVGDCLRLYTLGSIDNEQRSLAGSNRTAHFVAEVHVTRSVDEVKGITLIVHLNGVGLNGDTALFLQIHVVEHLIFHLLHVHRLRYFQHAVSESRFAVVDMRYDTKIAYIFHYLCTISSKKRAKLHKNLHLCKKSCTFACIFKN